MRIMMVSPLLPYLPCHEGFRLLPAHLLEHLSCRHAVAVVAPLTAAQTPAQRAWTAGRAASLALVPAGRWRRALTGAPAEGLAALRTAVTGAVERFKPDVLHLEGALMAPLAAVGGVPTVLSCHESPALRARDARRGAQRPWARLRATLDERVERGWEQRWFASVDGCVVRSEADRAAIGEHLSVARVDVIPAGIDPAQYALRQAGLRGRLVFTGDLASSRDAAAARRLALDILPRVRQQWPRADLLIAGAHAAPAVVALAALPGVRVSTGVSDPRPSVWSGAVYVSAPRAGFGSNAPIVEAMALGTPVVAAPCALSGLAEVRAGHHVLTAHSDAEFAEAALALLREPGAAGAMARHARDLVERRYTWRTVAERFEQVYGRMAAGDHTRARARDEVAA
jgi:glycosyltransferase involved in cell wall biosynthesis